MVSHFGVVGKHLLLFLAVTEDCSCTEYQLNLMVLKYGWPAGNPECGREKTSW